MTSPGLIFEIFDARELNGVVLIASLGFINNRMGALTNHDVEL
jgi:hypothetical protein